MNIEILFEDEYLVVVNKPNNVLVHKSHYARNITDPTLEDYLKKQTGTDLHLVHRLDYKTSGVLILTKKKEIIKHFQNLFVNNEIQKKYLAVVRGFIEKDMIVDTPVKHPETKVYKEAETHCKPLLIKELDIAVKPYDKSRYSLIELTPKTGRIHQLRIHMNKISHPIIGDYKYGDRFHNRMFENDLNCTNLFLHAKSLSFKHPFYNKRIEVKANLSPNWYTLFKTFEWKYSI